MTVTSAPEAAGSPAHTGWPYQGLDVAAVRASGLAPVPLREFILKLHSRCDLACDYCYLYTAGDDSWLRQPKVMAPATARRAVARIIEHVRDHRLDGLRLVLHGGEPLLAGPAMVEEVITALRSGLPAGTDCDVIIQTNGVRLTEQWLRLFHECGVRVGVSMDGDPVTHDRHRRDRRGQGSHAAVARALDLLTQPEHRGLFAGILCTIDVASDPLTVYEALLTWRPPTVNLLLPHGTWAAPPPGWSGGAPYARWLEPIFDAWFDSPVPPTRVAFFDEILRLLLGGASTSELIGLSPVASIVIETDGSLAQVDTLRAAYAGAAATTMDVWRHGFDEALDHPGLVARQIGRSALHDTCRRCPLVGVCGGGYYVHRYHPDHGFRHPSVYCADLTRLITHIQRRVALKLEDLPGGGTCTT